MSTNTTSTTTVVSCTAELGRSLPALERERQALADGWNSMRIRELAAEGARLTPVSLDDLNGMWSDVTQGIPGDWHQLPERAEVALAQAEQSLLAAAQSGLPLDVVALDELRDTIGSAVEQAAMEVARMERAVRAEMVALSLPALDYQVIRTDGEHVTSFEATREHDTVLIELQDGGRMISDYALLSDDSCETAHTALLDELATYGLEVESEERTAHRDPRGGWLIAEAARARQTSLAAGNTVEGDRRYRECARTLFDTAQLATVRRVSQVDAR